MPEYLAPGVYVEEVPAANTPIEGVSTSTVGVVGVTERGPVGVPTLVTSYADYRRTFGGYLDPAHYQNGLGRHSFLPHAIEGFFTNGGRRAYIVRALEPGAAQRAHFDLGDRGAAGGGASRLLRGAGESTGAAGLAPGDAPPYLLDTTGFADGERARIGDGSAAEYRQLADVGGATTVFHLPFDLPLAHSHDDGAIVRTLTPTDGETFHLLGDHTPGTSRVRLVEQGAAADVTTVGVDALLQFGTDERVEFRRVTDVFRVTVPPGDPDQVDVVLDAPLALNHAGGSDVTQFTVAEPTPDSTLSGGARPGTAVAFVNDANALIVAGTLLGLFPVGAAAGGTPTEMRRLGALAALPLDVGSTGPLGLGATVEHVTMAATGDGGVLTADAEARSVVLEMDDRRAIVAGTILELSGPVAADSHEFAVVLSVPDPGTGTAADPGRVLLAHPLSRAHTTGAMVEVQDPPAAETAGPATAVVLAEAIGVDRIVVGHGTGYVAGHTILVRGESGLAIYLLEADADLLTPRPVQLSADLGWRHEAGEAVAERGAIFRVEALDAGVWGNRLLVSVQDEPAGLLARTTTEPAVDASTARLATISGVEAGTILEFLDPATGDRVGGLIKVTAVDRATRTVALADPLAVPQQVAGLNVRSREFAVDVVLLRQPDTLNPSRDDEVIDRESFRHLSMDARHSRYIERVLGAADPASAFYELRDSDRRPAGESGYVRVRDLAPDDAARQSVRLGPEALVDVFPSGQRRSARHRLAGGDDALATLTDATYEGADAPEPENRTGLHSLRNVHNVSIVAIPGQSRPALRALLVAHCENERYRFAVLDSPTPEATISDVIGHRQQFDTSYAAIYYPWLLVPNPFPPTPSQLQLAVPPSGHVLGVYARTDVERGVHKAPANEVVRGITGLTRSLNKSEQDILNPYPIHVNVIRDFRRDGRGLRVWGARVITSDTAMKYVPVRRLLIFVEQSIERGVQYVVFEPNAEPLWARVRRSITSFLTTVWRNGALEGTSEEEAFFVKCDRTTMTQDDIDNGRLICLVGIAPVKPAEFVIVRIGLKTRDARA